MRAEAGNSDFCKIPLDVGNRKYPEINNDHVIKITSTFCMIDGDTKTLVQSIYGHIHNQLTKDE